MKNKLIIGLGTLMSLCALLMLFGAAGAESNDHSMENDHEHHDVIFAIHGGTGTVSEDEKDDYREVMEEALEAGKDTITDGGSSIEAVESAILILEDSPIFNAGRGAVFNTDASHELDASIMNGKDLNAGAVAGVKNIKNPILLAREVMDESIHVMLGGDGADLFGINQGLETVTQDYFFTERRWNALLRAKERDEAASASEYFGTVGAVAFDENENLAAGTSTGGLTNKAVGRIGDSPIIGAGTYANNNSVAVSATGTGEVFIRGNAAHDISALIEYGEHSVYNAAKTVVVDKLPPLGGTGGVIALDKDGNLAAPFSTSGLKYGYVTKDGEIVVELQTEEEEPPISAADIQTLVENFEDEGEFANDEAPRSLFLLLMAVSEFEDQEAAEKVVKHMESFKDLLDHQKDNESISEEAYNTLMDHSDDLIERWQ